MNLETVWKQGIYWPPVWPSTMQLPSFYTNALNADMGKTIVHVKAYCRYATKDICILHLDTKMGPSYQFQASTSMQCICKDSGTVLFSCWGKSQPCWSLAVICFNHLTIMIRNWHRFLHFHYSLIRTFSDQVFHLFNTSSITSKLYPGWQLCSTGKFKISCFSDN